MTEVVSGSQGLCLSPAVYLSFHNRKSYSLVSNQCCNV